MYYLDFGTQQYIEKTITTPLGKGCRISPDLWDPVLFNGSGMQVHFSTQANRKEIKVLCADFGGISLDAKFHVHYPRNHQTMSVVIPWSSRNFQYTSKHNCLPAQGEVRLGEKKQTFNTNDTFACLDFGSGVWPFSSFWNWASFSGHSRGHTIGINLGAGWTNGTGLTENSLTCDGKVTKLSEDIQFEYDPKNFMAPWRIVSTASDRVRLSFAPCFERKARTDVLLLNSSVHQMYGHFTGTIVPEGHRPIPVKNIIGWAEDHHARW